MPTIKKVGLIAKKHNREALELSREVDFWLREQGVATFHLEKNQDYALDRVADLQDTDLALVFGGDGTMINAARHLAGSGIPIAGINLGRVGFLLELSPDNWRDALKKALQTGLELDRRMLLRCELEREGEILSSEIAANEVVVSRNGIVRLIAMDLAINGRKILYLRADGLILSTPTGTTAYASSAGGPLLHPSLQAYCATPICPFLNKLSPMVLNGSDVLTAKVRETSSKTYLTIDGQSPCKLQTGDSIRVTGVPDGLVFANFGVEDYYSKLLANGIVRDSPGETKN